MRDVIEIEGGVVRLLRHGARDGLQRLPLLPMGTRFLLGRAGDLAIGVEQPPQVRHFPWRPGGTPFFPWRSSGSPWGGGSGRPRRSF